MKINRVEIREITGRMPTKEHFFEDRQVNPRDIYPEFRYGTGEHTRHYGAQNDDGTYNVSLMILEIESDEGVIGISRVPFNHEGSAFHIEAQLKPLIMGQSPLAIEKIWDQMHRTLVHGRQGVPMIAISSVDNALWDLKGKYLNQPVYSLIGGPVSEEMTVYASMLGFNATDMGLVKERSKEIQDKGFSAQKWFFRYGPADGAEGLEKNVDLVRTLRETLGTQNDIMLDCWQSFDVNYTLKLTERIEEFSPRWIEECLMPDRIESHLRIKEKTKIPLSGAEHEYTRWGFKRWIDSGALDILQPDVSWAGGLSEVLKIAAMATANDLITICHQGISPEGLTFSASQSPIHTPYVEMLLKHSELAYFLAKKAPKVQKGKVKPLEGSGLGFELDDNKIEKSRIVSYF